MKFDLISEEKFKYVEQGEGEVVLLLHGLFGALSNFSVLIEHFSKNYKVVIPMLPLYELPREEISVMALKNFIVDFVEYKQLEKLNLVGNSLGGHIALLFCLHHAEKVSSLTLTGSSGLYESALGDGFPRRGDYDYISKKTQEVFFNPDVATKELIDEVFDTVNDRRKAMNVVLTAKSAIRQNMETHLHKLTMPSLLIWGKEDKVTPAFVGEKFDQLLPNSELHLLNNCGHAPMMELPETFNRILDNFLLNVTK